MPQSAVITGASAGLGRDLALRFGSEGFDVTAFGRRENGPDGTNYHPIDQESADAVDAMLAVCPEAPDTVILSAVSYPSFTQPTQDLATMERLFRVNALQPYLLGVALMAREQSNPCSIIVINSESMFHADRVSCAYGSSKAALRVLTGGLAEAARGTHFSVSTLLLGPLDDAVKRASIDTVVEQRGLTHREVTARFLRQSNPDLVIDRLIDHDTCFAAIEFLIRAGADANGTVLRLDGGSAGTLI